MPLLTTGAILTGVGAVWKFWRVPYTFYRWKASTYKNPVVGQVWAFARFSPLESTGKSWHTFKVIGVDEENVTFESNWVPDLVDEIVQPLGEWHTTMKKLRAWLLHDTDDLEVQFFGDAAED